MVIKLIENRYYTIEFLKGKLGCSYEEILSLCEKKRIINWNSTNQSLSFQFVGILFHRDLTLIFFPKYLKNTHDIEEKEFTSLLIQVLHKYQKSLLETAYDDEMLEEVDDKQFHVLGTISYLLQQYIDFGLYIKEHEVQDTLFEGEIDWDNTISNTNAYLTIDSKPIYLDLIKTYSETDENAKITDLHKFLLNQCSHFIQSHHLDLIFSWPQVFFETAHDWENNLDEGIYLIEKEMLIEFQDHKLRLLQNLKFYIEQLKSMRFTPDTFMIGTKYFYHVWEKCCANVLGHDPTIQMNISNPEWHMGTETFHSEKTLKPDFLKTYKLDHLKLLLIFDAKYYVLNYDSKISNIMNAAPVVGDITKQYMYQKALDKYANDNAIQNIYNAFLLPSLEEVNFQIKGTVRFDFITTLQPIKLVYLNAQSLFSNYLNDIAWNTEELNDLMKELQKN